MSGGELAGRSARSGEMAAGPRKVACCPVSGVEKEADCLMVSSGELAGSVSVMDSTSLGSSVLTSSVRTSRRTLPSSL